MLGEQVFKKPSAPKLVHVDDPKPALGDEQAKLDFFNL
jgi:hypothetical protein